MQNNHFELDLVFDITTPYKRWQKEELITHLKNQLLKTGCNSVDLKETYYIDKKSTEALHSFVLVLKIMSPLLAIASSAILIKTELLKAGRSSSVFLKNNAEKTIKIDENTTIEKIQDELNESKN